MSIQPDVPRTNTSWGQARDVIEARLDELEADSGTSVTSIAGSVDTAANLPASAPEDVAYVTQDTKHLWAWDGTEWIDLGTVQGPAGQDAVVDDASMAGVVATDGTATRAALDEHYARDHVEDATKYGLSPSATWQVNRDAVQAAIDAARAAGGGVVLIPPGTYQAKDIVIRSRVTIYGPGATLVHPDGITGAVLSSATTSTTGTTTAGVSSVPVADASGIEVGTVVKIRGANGQHQTQQTSLTAAATSSATTLTVASTAAFPSSGVLRVGSEFIFYSGTTSTSFTGLTRGGWGSTAAAHSSGAVVPLASTLYAVVTGKAGSTIYLDRPAVTSATGVDVTAGTVGLVVDGLTVDAAKTSGAHFGVMLELARDFSIPALTVHRGGQGGLYLSGCMDSHGGRVVITETGQPASSMGAGFWCFRACERVTIDHLAVTGEDVYHGVYIDDRTQTGVEDDAPNVDIVVKSIDLDLARQGMNTGWHVVGGSRTKLLGGTIRGPRNAIVVDSNQHYRADGGVQPSTGNLVRDTSLDDCFIGVAFRQPGQVAENIPCSPSVNIPIHLTERQGSTYRGVGYGFGLPERVDLSDPPHLAGVRGAVYTNGTLNTRMRVGLDTLDQHPPPGVLTVSALVQPDDWTTSGVIAGKWGTGTSRTWLLKKNGTGLLFGAYFTSGLTFRYVSAPSVGSTLPSGAPVWLRGRVTPDGAGNVTLDIDWASVFNVDDPFPPPDAWTNMATASFADGPTYQPSALPVYAGGADGDSGYFAGRIYRVVVQHHGGKVALNADFRTRQVGLVYPDMTGRHQWTPQEQVTYVTG